MHSALIALLCTVFINTACLVCMHFLVLYKNKSGRNGSAQHAILSQIIMFAI